MAAATLSPGELAASFSSAGPSSSVDPPTASSSAASSTSSPNQYNNGTMHTLSTVMPAFLIAFVCVVSIFLACGIFHGRRRRAMLLRHMPSAPAALPTSPRRPTPTRTRKKKRLVRPKLWEVDAKSVGYDWELEELEPVAVELQADPQPLIFKAESPRRSPWFPGLGRSHKPEDNDPPPQRAQVTVLVTMPNPRRAAGMPSREFAIGTTHLPYRQSEPDDEDEKQIERESRMRIHFENTVLVV